MNPEILLVKTCRLFVPSKFVEHIRHEERDRCLRKLLETEPETVIKPGRSPNGEKITKWLWPALNNVLGS